MRTDVLHAIPARLLVAALALTLGACASTPPPSVPAPAVAPERHGSEYERALQLAMQAAQPRTGSVARARAQLEALLAAHDESARVLHPYARSLLEQLAERQRLDAANMRLTQQLERSGQQLKDSQQRADELQRKIDALADIERSLPVPVRIPSRGLPR